MKVLIVEDERRAARAIGRMVNQHPSFSVAGMALNGQEAMEFLAQTPVELVITDIRMPLMGGVQLMEHIHREFPEILLVVISGFSQFDYAKAALQNDAFDYLLKPVNQEELFLLLDKAEARLSSRSHNQQRALLQRALLGDVSDCDSGIRYHIAMLHAGESELVSVQDSFWNDPEQLALQKRILGHPELIFNGITNNQRLLFLDSPQTIKNALEPYFHQAAALARVPVNLVYTQNAVPLGEIHTAVRRLRLTLSLRMELFSSDIFSVDHLQPLPAPKGSPLKDMHPERAVEAICTQDRYKLTQTLRDMLVTADEYGSLVADVEAYLTSVLGDSRIAYQISPAILSQTKGSLQEAVSRATEPEQCIEDMTNLLFALQGDTMPKLDEADVVADVAYQIETNYHLALSVETLAKQHNLTSAYLSKIFKQHKDIRPSEYLLNVRMERARQILETNPETLVKDVASSVGYSDPYYFSKVFKRTTGLWPTEVQKKK